LSREPIGVWIVGARETEPDVGDRRIGEGDDIAARPSGETSEVLEHLQIATPVNPSLTFQGPKSPENHFFGPASPRNRLR